MQGSRGDQHRGSAVNSTGVEATGMQTLVGSFTRGSQRGQQGDRDLVDEVHGEETK